jgi:DMSO/TMAO reductase YedYZ molybdopterin-dependent catalytic subunit
MRRGRLRTLVIAMTAIASAMAVSVSGVLAQSRDAAPRAVAAGAIAVTGNVQQPLRLSVADLAAMPDQQTVNATFAAGGAPEAHVFTGPRLRDVLARAVPRFDPAIKNDKLRHYASVTASDGYQALVGYGELDPSFEGKQILLAVTQDGASLAGSGPRLVVPGDTAGGRYVSGVTDVVLTKPSAAIGEATAPLQASVDGLTSALAASAGDLSEARASLTHAEAEIASLKAARRTLELSMPAPLPPPAGLASRGLALRLQGPASRATSVRLLIAAVKAKKLGLRSRVIASRSVTIGADGTAAFVMKPAAAAARALRRQPGRLALLAEATAGDRRSLATATIGR